MKRVVGLNWKRALAYNFSLIALGLGFLAAGAFEKCLIRLAGFESLEGLSVL